MNNIVSNKTPYVEVVYISYNTDVASMIAKQISQNLNGASDDGNPIDDNPFMFNKTINKAWKLTNYPTYFSVKDKDTEKLTFPDPGSVDQYIDD